MQDDNTISENPDLATFVGVVPVQGVLCASESESAGHLRGNWERRCAGRPRCGRIRRGLRGHCRPTSAMSECFPHVAMPQVCPDCIRQLLDAAEAQAQAAARTARQATAAQLKELQAQRQHIVRQNALNGAKLELPAAPAELLALYMRVYQYRYVRSATQTGWFGANGGPRELQHAAEVLGVNVPRPETQKTAA